VPVLAGVLTEQSVLAAAVWNVTLYTNCGNGLVNYIYGGNLVYYEK
jgi:hypothetical protein